jgi:DNA primase large subunit
MDYSPSAKELSHFPFLKKAQDHVRGRFSSLDSLLADPRNETLIERSAARVQIGRASCRERVFRAV